MAVPVITSREQQNQVGVHFPNGLAGPLQGQVAPSVSSVPTILIHASAKLPAVQVLDIKFTPKCTKLWILNPLLIKVYYMLSFFDDVLEGDTISHKILEYHAEWTQCLDRRMSTLRMCP